MRRLIAQVVSMMVLLVAGMILVPGTASAHSALKSSNPSAGQVLRAAPDSLELVFNEHLRPNSSQVAVTVGDATPVQVKLSETEDSLTADLTAADLPLVPEGTAVPWKIGFRIVSEDGHPVSGVIEFRVDRTLLTSSPAEGAVLSSAPPAIDLTFAQPIAAADPIAVTVGDSAERQVTAAVGGDRVQIPLAGTEFTGDGPQAWRIGYRVTSAGGEVLTGLLTFTVDPASGTAPVSPEPLSAPPAELTSVAGAAPSSSAAVDSVAAVSGAAASSPESGADAPSPEQADTGTSGGGSGVVLWVVIAVVLLVIVGGLVGWRLRARGGARSRS